MSNLLRRTQDRLTKTKVCNPFDNTEDIATTDLRVSFEIDTLNPIDDLTSAFAISIPDLVQGAAVESVHYTICQEGLDILASRRSDIITSIEECVYSINSHEPEELTYCQDASTPNCVAFQGGIKIFHKQNCPGDIDFAALLALEQGVQTGRYIASVNKRLQQFDNMVTQVVAVEDGAELLGVVVISSQQDKDIVAVYTEEKVTAGGVVMIVIVGFLLILLGVLLFMYRRLDRRYQRDIKSVMTGYSGEDEGAESYASADFNRLAQQSSKMDVHRCTSAVCPVCLSNPDEVHMVTVPKNRPGLGSDSYEEYEARDEGVEAIAQEDDVNFSAKNQRKVNRFSPFRKKAPVTENISFARVVSATGSLESAYSQDTYDL
uniref:Uncharacterized protein n=1 Tax=Amphora coffeiformis TaxID=265554 RepID=A0A7S3P6M4_9STRA|mmetsp:Transcript_12060/g.23173  ORF Transcript_12060/g.23173 Transcript_12060/m.23173 type:complete len:376 (+) Transcript_12060:149-1276(+)|eukprot:scaffold701_cov158-Amphora_coffeaeformis.AAC.3